MGRPALAPARPPAVTKLSWPSTSLRRDTARPGPRRASLMEPNRSPRRMPLRPSPATPPVRQLGRVLAPQLLEVAKPRVTIPRPFPTDGRGPERPCAGRRAVRLRPSLLGLGLIQRSTALARAEFFTGASSAGRGPLRGVAGARLGL